MARKRQLRRAASMHVRARSEEHALALPISMLPADELPTLAELHEKLPPLELSAWRSIQYRPTCPEALKCVGHFISEVPRYSNIEAKLRKHCCPLSDCHSVLSNPKLYEQCISKGHFKVCMAHGYGTAVGWSGSCYSCDSILARSHRIIQEQQETLAIASGNALSPAQRRKGITMQWLQWFRPGKERKERRPSAPSAELTTADEHPLALDEDAAV